MKLRTRVFFPLLLLTMVATSWSQSQGTSAPIDAKPGNVATGHIESEGGNSLYLNQNPCEPRSRARIVVFHQPYRKTASGEITCYPSRFDRVTVEQE
jgi:hypothetical protein